MKFLKNFRLMLNEVDPGKLAVVINKTNIILFSANRLDSLTPYIREHKF